MMRWRSGGVAVSCELERPLRIPQDVSPALAVDGALALAYERAEANIGERELKRCSGKRGVIFDGIAQRPFDRQLLIDRKPGIDLHHRRRLRPQMEGFHARDGCPFEGLTIAVD